MRLCSSATVQQPIEHCIQSQKASPKSPTNCLSSHRYFMHGCECWCQLLFLSLHNVLTEVEVKLSFEPRSLRFVTTARVLSKAPVGLLVVIQHHARQADLNKARVRWIATSTSRPLSTRRSRRPKCTLTMVPFPVLSRPLNLRDRRLECATVKPLTLQSTQRPQRVALALPQLH